MVFQRAIARLCRDQLGYTNARSGAQYRGGSKDGADIVGVDPWHMELKHGVKPNPRAALEQAIRDAKEGLIPIAIIKDNHCEPFVVMRWRDFVGTVAPAISKPQTINSAHQR